MACKNHSQLAREVRANLAAGMKFYDAFKEVMRENDILTDWDIHASEIGKVFAGRRKKKKTRHTSAKMRRKILADARLADQIVGAENAALERNDHLLSDP